MFDPQAEELIEKFFDGTLEEAERKRLGDLIATTRQVERDFEDTGSLRRLLMKSRPETFGPGFFEAVRSSLANENGFAGRFDQHKSWHFQPSFLSTVMQTVRQEPAWQTSSSRFALGDRLVRLFPRLAVPCFAVTCVAAVLNINASPPEAPLLDKLIGLQSVNAQPLNVFEFGQE